MDYHASTDSTAHYHMSEAVRHFVVLDSIYRHDSIYIHERADTVFMEKFRTEYQFRGRTFHDTLRLTDTLHIQHTDTLRLIEARVKTQKEVPKFYKWCTFGFWLMIIGIILYIILRLYSK